MPQKTRLLTLDPEFPDEIAISRGAKILRARGLVAFPTETVYGLGAAAIWDEAVAGIFRAKGRPAFNPCIVHVSDIEMACGCVGDWPELAQRSAERFWPGPLTLVLPKAPTISKLATGGGSTVAVRMPASLVALRLIEKVALPIAAPSANRSNHVSPTTANHVLDDLDGLIDLVLDAGPTSVGLESTVLDLTQTIPVVLRPGSITAEEISAALGIEIAEHFHNGAISSPGLLPIHYAPAIPAFRVESNDDLARISWPDRATVFLFDPHHVELPANVRVLSFADPDEAGRSLYRCLRECEADGSTLIVVAMPEKGSPSWRAVRDRLTKATKPLLFS